MLAQRPLANAAPPAALAALGLVAGAVLAADAAAPAPAHKGVHCPFLHWANRIGLNLTDDQKAKVVDIVKNRHEQVKAVLTADQLKVLQDAKGPKAKRAAWQQVRSTLTADQTAKIKELRQASRAAIKAVLTPEQLDKIKAWRQEHKGAHRQPSATAPGK